MNPLSQVWGRCFRGAATTGNTMAVAVSSREAHWKMAVGGWVVSRGWILAALCAIGWIHGGCASTQRFGPVRVVNSNLGPMTVAVAPALNLSGSSDFDPDRFADTMAVELGYVDRISVIPVNRALAVLASQGRKNVMSPDHALELARLLGADAILLFAVTDYDPYDPPSIGISAQLYGQRPGTGGRSLDPVALSRQPGLVAAAEHATGGQPLAQTQRVFDAALGSVGADIRKFAAQRSGGESPFGWREYVVSQRHFIQYCCHATVRALFSSEDPQNPADSGKTMGLKVGKR